MHGHYIIEQRNYFFLILLTYCLKINISNTKVGLLLFRFTGFFKLQLNQKISQMLQIKRIGGRLPLFQTCITHTIYRERYQAISVQCQTSDIIFLEVLKSVHRHNL